MAQQIDNDTLGNNGSNLENRNSTLTSMNNSSKAESAPVLEAEIVDNRSFSERWKTNRFWLVRGSYTVLRSVWIVAMFIGGAIAWLISLLFI